MFCRNCGKEINDNSKFCQYCGAEIKNPESNNNNENGCSGCGKGCLIAIVILFGLAFLGNLTDSDTDNNTSNSTQIAKQEQTVKNTTTSNNEEREKIKKVNKLIEDAKKGGLIIKFKQAFVGDMAQKEPNVYVCVVDEYVWNQLPHESKQQMVSLMEDYSRIKGWKIISFEGYRTGKSMVNAMYAIKNF